MLAELAEARAEGAIADIYREIRDTTSVPYVSSLQRHLATRSGWLEWAWAVVGPGFRNGDIPAAMWHVAAELEVPQLPVASRSALRSLGVTPVDEAAIHNVLDSFIRVSPTNLGFSGIVRRVLLGEANVPKAPLHAPRRVQAALQPLPALVDIDTLAAHERDVLMMMATTVDGEVFIPGLYRMLARWPAWFAHAVTVLSPSRGEAEAACATLAARIDATVPALMHGVAAPQPPASGQAATRVVGAIDRYRITSPQMVVYSRMLKASLPVVEPRGEPRP